MLDLGLVKVFELVFPFLLVWSMVFGIFEYTKVFGDKKGLRSFIAMILAFMTLFAPVVLRTINIMAPWFAFLFLFIVFGVLAMMSLGATHDDVTKYIKKPESEFIYYWILALVLIVSLGSLFKAVSEFGGVPGFNDPGGGTGQEQQFWKTLFHPKVLGMIFIMLVAMFTVMKLGEP